MGQGLKRMATNLKVVGLNSYCVLLFAGIQLIAVSEKSRKNYFCILAEKRSHNQFKHNYVQIVRYVK
jgi:hypothetical protein